MSSLWFLMRSPMAAGAALCMAGFMANAGAWAAEPEFLLQIKAHRFEPADLRVPANARIKLVVHNTDASAEEFESHALNREKLVPAGGQTTIYIGPLKPGRYEFFGEFNPASARGAIVAE